jgi:hypothetical protein
MHSLKPNPSVIPAQAGIQRVKRNKNWIPAFAGMTGVAVFVSQ